MSETSSDDAVDFVTHEYPFFRDVSGFRDGVDLRHRTVAPGRAFAPVLAGEPFQVNEFSLANYALLRDRGDERMAAIPVFLNRAFRQGSLYVRRDSDLTHPSQLRGRTVGAREYTQTAGVWWRGTMIDEYDLHWSEIRWVSGKLQRFAPPDEAAVEAVEGDLEQMLIDGAIDGFLAPNTKDEAKSATERQLRGIFPDTEAAERDYFARTGFYPINHIVAVHRSCLARHPGVASAVFDACCASKKQFYRKKGMAGPWGEPASVDPMPFGLTDRNREIVGTLMRYLHEQKFIAAIPDIDDLFVPGAAGFTDS